MAADKVSHSWNWNQFTLQEISLHYNWSWCLLCHFNVQLFHGPKTHLLTLHIQICSYTNRDFCGLWKQFGRISFLTLPVTQTSNLLTARTCLSHWAACSSQPNIAHEKLSWNDLSQLDRIQQGAVDEYANALQHCWLYVVRLSPWPDLILHKTCKTTNNTLKLIQTILKLIQRIIT